LFASGSERPVICESHDPTGSDLAVALDALDARALREKRSIKWRAYPSDVLPAWVAEMDLPIAAPIRERLAHALERNDLGYPALDHAGVRLALCEWLRHEYAWDLGLEAVVVLPDTMRGIELAIVALTGEGDRIVVPTPAYPPFIGAVADARRTLVEVELRRDERGFSLDLEGIENAFRGGARMLLLCHPHNPTGTVIPFADLRALADLAAEYGAVVVSDEIHAPLTYSGRRHQPFALVSDDAKDHTITVTSASKAWNVPGLRCAFLVAERSSLLDPILALPLRMRIGYGILGIEAATAALDDGRQWLDAALGLLERNRDIVSRAVAQMPGAIRSAPPAATYLAWLDCRELALPGGPYEFFLGNARVALSDGREFGSGGDGFVRLNFATSRPVLLEILDRMHDALGRVPGATASDSSGRG
jgi:cystathionine beta-lyase